MQSNVRWQKRGLNFSKYETKTPLKQAGFFYELQLLQIRRRGALFPTCILFIFNILAQGLARRFLYVWGNGLRYGLT